MMQTCVLMLIPDRKLLSEQSYKKNNLTDKTDETDKTIKSTEMQKLINALGFQFGWFVCIASVRHNLEIFALFLCAVLVGLHLFYSRTRILDCRLTLICLGSGIVLDSLLQYFLIIDFYGWALGPFSPFWLWMIWAMFGLTLNSSLSFLQNHHMLLSAFAGLIFGPLSYLAGTKLGAAHLTDLFISLGTIALIWMITLPLLVIAANYPSQPKEVPHDAP